MPAILVNDVSPVISYTATAGQTLFSIPFEFFAVQDIVVERAGVTLTYSPTPANNNQFSVIGANLEGGGSITLGSPGATLGDKIVIFRDIAIERLANYPETGPMAVRSLNAEQAKHIGMMQQLERDVNRSVTVPIGESSIDLPSAAERAEKILTFDAAGVPVADFDIGLLTGAVISSGAAPAQNIEFTATASQTVFNFVYDAIPTYVSVFLNGVKLPTTDFTHSGTTVTLLTPATVGDRVALEGFTQSAVLEALATLGLSTGSSLVGHIATGTGAVARTVQTKLRELAASPEDFGGSLGADILEAATASSEIKLARGATYTLSATVNLSALNGRVIYLNGATITGGVGFSGTHLLAVSGDTQIIGPGTFNGANVAAPTGAYASGAYAGVGVFITGTGNFGKIEGVRFTNFQSGPILHDSTTTRNGFVVRDCSFFDVQKYTSNETNGVVHLHGVSYGLMANNLLETYNFKGYYTANANFTRMVECHSSGGNAGHASHYISGGNDCEIIDCSHTGTGFGAKCFQSSRPVIRNFSCPSASSAVYVQGCLNFTIDGVDAPSPTNGAIYVEGVNGFPTSGLVRGVKSKRAAAGTTASHLGVYIAGSGTGTVSNVKVTECYFENMLWGVQVVNTGVAQTDIEIIGNEFRNTGQYGVLGYMGSGKICDNLFEMDNAAVECAVYLNRDGVTTTGTVQISRNEIRGCTGDNIQIGGGGRLNFRAIIIRENYGSGGARLLTHLGNANAADTVSYLEVAENAFSGLSNGCAFTFNTTTSTRLKYVGNILTNGSFAFVNDTYTNLSNVTIVEFREQRGTVTLAAGTASVPIPITEPDANYLVQISGGVNETFYWSAKTTGTFSITSSNAGSTAVVNWIIGR